MLAANLKKENQMTFAIWIAIKNSWDRPLQTEKRNRHGLLLESTTLLSQIQAVPAFTIGSFSNSKKSL